MLYRAYRNHHATPAPAQVALHTRWVRLVQLVAFLLVPAAGCREEGGGVWVGERGVAKWGGWTHQPALNTQWRAPKGRGPVHHAKPNPPWHCRCQSPAPSPASPPVLPPLLTSPRRAARRQRGAGRRTECSPASCRTVPAPAGPQAWAPGGLGKEQEAAAGFEKKENIK